ncbi:MAG TPA: S41 family peptidase [Terriglobales bacterium]|nr:S41 family peptidase [Terriglobales bacterium]
MQRVFSSSLVAAAVLILLFTVGAWSADNSQNPGQQQSKISSLDRERAQHMFDNVATDIRKHYYDPQFHGVDWDANVREYKARIDKAATMNMALSHIAAALAVLNDSHTFFVPPQHAYRHDYGWRMQMVGEHCYVVQVRPRSDAQSKAVKPGDEILTIDGFAPDRSNLWKMEYVYNLLRPQAAVRLNLRDPAGATRQLDVAALIKMGPVVKDVTGNGVWDLVRAEEDEEHASRVRYADIGKQLLMAKLPSFGGDEEIDRLLSEARKHEQWILDLRGNPGGYEDALKLLIGGIFEHDVKIGDRVGREIKHEELLAKHSHHPFNGKIIVLIDSRSASAAELFARVVQIEKRGLVLGDRSSGSVMEARSYSYHLGSDTIVPYGASITHGDLLMADGKSLEHGGVTPDEIVLPTAADMGSGRDPVLARAAEILGAKLTPEDAGALFPYEWRPE